MNKINALKDSSFKNNNSHEETPGIYESNSKLDKVLCNHCGRTARNGIKCQGICVADNDY